MWHELTTRRDLYERVFLEGGRVDAVLASLNSPEVSPVQEEHWFSLPDMPHIVATIWNVAFVVLTPQVSVTYLPLLSSPTSVIRVICMALVNNNHFISVIKMY